MPHFTLHAVGTNRPGIVSAVTTAIAAQGWDIGDSEMTLLEGQFAIVLVLDSGTISDGRLIEQALGQVAEELDLFIAVRPIHAVPEPFASTSSIGLAVSGANKPGIVAGITDVLSSNGADIHHLESRLVDGPAGPRYVMELEAALPASTRRDALETALLRRAVELGVECTIVPHEG
jgi:glycine cleavage system transcriptional repressor